MTVNPILLIKFFNLFYLSPVLLISPRSGIADRPYDRIRSLVIAASDTQFVIRLGYIVVGIARSQKTDIFHLRLALLLFLQITCGLAIDCQSLRETVLRKVLTVLYVAASV